MLNGILNNNGFEQKIRIKLNSCDYFPYDTDMYINNIKYPCKIDYDTITFLSSQYEYKIKKTDDELLVIGKERRNILHIILCCIYKPKFFVLTNKEEV